LGQVLTPILWGDGRMPKLRLWSATAVGAAIPANSSLKDKICGGTAHTAAVTTFTAAAAVPTAMAVPRVHAGPMPPPLGRGRSFTSQLMVHLPFRTQFFNAPKWISGRRFCQVLICWSFLFRAYCRHMFRLLPMQIWQPYVLSSIKSGRPLMRTW
jgi:hypothetical protein